MLGYTDTTKVKSEEPHFLISLVAFSLQRRNVWPKLPAIMSLKLELQGASLLPTRPLRLLLRQWLVWDPLWEAWVWYQFSFLYLLKVSSHISSPFIWHFLFSVVSLSKRHVRTRLQAELSMPEWWRLQPFQWMPVSHRVERPKLWEVR